MKIIINYNPDPAETRKAILKTYTAAVRTKYALLADHEVTQGKAVLERRMAEIEVNGGELNIELGRIFAEHGPDALEAALAQDDQSEDDQK